MIPLFASSFLFLRHGRTALNAEDRVQGAMDIPLDPIGEAEAQAAAETLAGQDIAAIWCSPLQRAHTTANIVGRRLGLRAQPVEGLEERNWGALEGQPRAVLVREATPPGGEGPEAFAARTRAGLARIAPPFPALVVAHSGTARVIAATLRPAEDVRRIGNGEVVLWWRTAQGWRLESLTGGPPLSLN